MDYKSKNTGEQNKRFPYIIWDIFKPFAIYYLLHSVTFLLLLSLCWAVAEGQGNESLEYLAKYTETMTGLVSGVAMMLAVLPLLPMLRRELEMHKSCRRSGKHGQATGAGGRQKGYTVFWVGATVVLAAASSLGLNSFLMLTGLVSSSASYQEVAQQQYGVAFVAGIVLYGLVSPITEEIVFRGLVFNRLRRYCPSAMAAVVSGLVFGIYHGNLVQGIYGGCMGILTAYLYERTHSFAIPCLFHGTANLVVYLAAQSTALYGWIFNGAGCAALFALSAVCIWMAERARACDMHGD